MDPDRPARLRSETPTWRVDRESYAAAHPLVPFLEVPASDFATRREQLKYPVPQQRSFFLPSQEARPCPREAWCEEILDALGLGVGAYFETTVAFRSIVVALS